MLGLPVAMVSPGGNARPRGGKVGYGCMAAGGRGCGGAESESCKEMSTKQIRSDSSGDGGMESLRCGFWFLRCLSRTARTPRRTRSAAGGWGWTWGSRRCAGTPSLSAAPPSPRWDPPHRGPAPAPAAWEAELTQEKKVPEVPVLVPVVDFYCGQHLRETNAQEGLPLLSVLPPHFLMIHSL